MMTLLESAGDRVRWLVRAATPTGRNRSARYAAAPVAALLAAVGLLTAGGRGDERRHRPCGRHALRGRHCHRCPDHPVGHALPSLSDQRQGLPPQRGVDEEQAVGWVRIAADAPAAGVSTSKDPVTIDESVEGHAGPLCETVTVQVEFWKLTYGSAVADEETASGTGAPPGYHFGMDSLTRSA